MMRGLGCFVFLLLTAFVYSQDFSGYINLKYSFQPEGIEYLNYNGQLGFLVSSLNNDGTIYLCHDDGLCDIWSRGEEILTGTAGLQVDYDNKLLYAANNGNFANLTSVGSVVALNLKDGSVAWNATVTKLGAKGAAKLVNDVSLPDATGNIYATESLQGLVFKVSSSGNASLFSSDSRLQPQDSLGIGANGIEIIEYNGEEYLLVGVSGLSAETSYILRIPIKSPKSTTVVQITNSDSVYGFDGLYYDRTSFNLYTVNSPGNLVQKLASSDGFQTATLISSITPKCPGAPVSTVVHLDNNPNYAGSVFALCPDSFSTVGPYQIENIQFYDVSTYYYYYYYYTSSASSLGYFFALAVCVIALAL